MSASYLVDIGLQCTGRVVPFCAVIHTVSAVRARVLFILRLSDSILEHWFVYLISYNNFIPMHNS
jgi:hypothetical protein